MSLERLRAILAANPRNADELAALLRRRGIDDERVLDAIRRVPRDRFVPEAVRELAWLDEPLPIGHGQTISQPFVVAYMTAALDVQPTHHVLEIGTGSGYQAAVLSQLCRDLCTIERYSDLLREAKARFDELGLGNITAVAGDGRAGLPDRAPFDRILVTAAGIKPPRALVRQLADGGILVMPVGGAHDDQELVRVRRQGRQLRLERLIPVRFVPLLPGVR